MFRWYRSPCCLVIILHVSHTAFEAMIWEMRMGYIVESWLTIRRFLAHPYQGLKSRAGVKGIIPLPFQRQNSPFILHQTLSSIKIRLVSDLALSAKKRKTYCYSRPAGIALDMHPRTDVLKPFKITTVLMLMILLSM